uniref:Thioredoxin-related transmembrane protein 1 n=2 Tax=Plectus sambesii TaxID=2011161 RepID=A0A914UKC3_9BILA
MAIKLTATLVLLAALVVVTEAKSKHLIGLTEENWRDLLTGEWMVEFHAPWCPACKDLQKAWNAFADWSKDLNIKVAEVDVTVNPGLSGRFLVTALPTIYHVKDGVFRSYTGPRDKNDFIAFVEEKKWTVVDPVASWKHPDSPQMAVVAMFFKLSMSVRDLHNYLVEEKGLPSWASYALFGGVTLLLGCILGFMIVCVIDVLFPANPPAPKDKKDQGKKKEQQQKKEKEQQKKKEEKARQSQDEEASQNSQNSQSEADSADESNVRQRKGGDSKTEKSPKPNAKAGTDIKKKK